MRQTDSERGTIYGLSANYACGKFVYGNGKLSYSLIRPLKYTTTDPEQSEFYADYIVYSPGVLQSLFADVLR